MAELDNILQPEETDPLRALWARYGISPVMPGGDAGASAMPQPNQPPVTSSGSAAAFQPKPSSLQLPDMGGVESARTAREQIFQQRPKEDDYRPGIWRTLGSALSGGAIAFAGHGSPQGIQEGMNVTQAGLTEPYRKAVSVWQPRMDEANREVQDAIGNYGLQRQRTMDQSTLGERSATEDYRQQEADRIKNAPPQSKQMQGPDGETHDYGWNPITHAFDIDQGKSGKQPKQDTARQRYEDAIAGGNQAEAAKWLKVMQDEARAGRTGERLPGDITPAQRQQRQMLAESNAKKQFDVIEDLLRNGHKEPDPNIPGKVNVRRFDQNDPAIMQMKQRAQNELENTYSELGIPFKHVEYSAPAAPAATQGGPAGARNYTLSSPGKPPLTKPLTDQQVKALQAQGVTVTPTK